MMQPNFIHLSIRSDYSIISGLNKPKALIKQSYLYNMPALGITDYGNLYGVIKFYKYSMKFGIKPIFGIKIKVQFLFSTFLSEINILATNDIGYKNLIILVSKARTKKNDTFFLKDDIVITQDCLVKYRTGLIILSGGFNGDFGKNIIYKNYEIIDHFISFYNQYFKNSYYFEIHRTSRMYEEIYIQYVIKLSKIYKIPIVATNDVCFINKKDFYVHKIKVSIYQGVSINSEKFYYQYSQEQYFKTEKEMLDLFFDIPSALKNTIEIAKRCNISISTGNYFIPKFCTNSIDIKDFLITKSVQGMQIRLKELYQNPQERKKIYKKYQERLSLELNIINKMNFPSYFLIVMEFIQWAKKNDIPVGPGRGSGAGSLVAYSLGITELDPLSFDLLFERFLNPDRTSMPDFDIDFCMEKRDLVIEHVASVYGKDKVSQIITFGTMSARSVIRDVGRSLGYPYGFVNKISQLIPLDIGITLEKSLSKEFDLIKLYKKDVEVKKIIDISKKLEGVIRNTGKHAGGIVIAPNKLTNFTPLQRDDNDIFVTQFDKNDIDYVGLLKFDFLGLRTLTIIHSSLNMINKYLHRNNQKRIFLNQIPFNDTKSFTLLKTAKTIAVFQLESEGMRDLILRLQPDCFEDIIALIALFRPGPLQSGMVDNFINRKHGKEIISYPDPKWQHISLKPILESTYGIILYQEQVMKIAQVLSGYTLSKADILQRAMSKKNFKEMSKQRTFFQNSAKKKGISTVLSSKIFDLLEKFSGYGFNKSHSVAYALISYQTLWMKANYPEEFLAAVMNSDIDNTDKIKVLIKECLDMKIIIVPPNINISHYSFRVNINREIIYGLGAIKGLGKSVISTIIKIKKKIKKFSSLFEFCMHIPPKYINKRVLEKLIYSGSFDSFNIPRSFLISLIPKAIKLSIQYLQSKNISQLILLQPIEYEKTFLYNQLKDYSYSTFLSMEILNHEKDVLGFYLTRNPLEEYLNELKNYTNGIRIKNIDIYQKSKLINIFGIVSSIHYKMTKNNQKILFLQLIDGIYHIEVTIFHKLIILNKNILIKDNILIVSGHAILNKFNKKLKFIAHGITDIHTSRNKYIKKIILFIKDKLNYKKIFNDIKNIIYPFLGGKIELYVCYKKKNINYKFQLHNRWNIYLDQKVINRLKNLLGPEYVLLKC
ncbi:DNA polymerase III subunit alpha [Buchnera aphidicola]|uniref:DNA polymerase III subunit alpha n=1 Tax=Buchnera aphidicola TaxID=9 RepID=UPI003464C5BD